MIENSSAKCIVSDHRIDYSYHGNRKSFIVIDEFVDIVKPCRLPFPEYPQRLIQGKTLDDILTQILSFHKIITIIDINDEVKKKEPNITIYKIDDILNTTLSLTGIVVIKNGYGNMEEKSKYFEQFYQAIILSSSIEMLYYYQIEEEDDNDLLKDEAFRLLMDEAEWRCMLLSGGTNDSFISLIHLLHFDINEEISINKGEVTCENIRYIEWISHVEIGQFMKKKEKYKNTTRNLQDLLSKTKKLI